MRMGIGIDFWWWIGWWISSEWLGSAFDVIPIGASRRTRLAPRAASRHPASAQSEEKQERDKN